eukprot:1160272-Pelagomonas_calceolata.AAC.6
MDRSHEQQFFTTMSQRCCEKLESFLDGVQHGLCNVQRTVQQGSRLRQAGSRAKQRRDYASQVQLRAGSLASTTRTQAPRSKKQSREAS